ncbi:RidA family protein [Aegicerativicinus sediminis]|uniref:RidA family protein n=1 Tax=Aegicerativicinus sediminis TaxID=2893202 RepID=UPI001E34045B|nr:RidA family protein [Aegicerativicinus sediminis]
MHKSILALTVILLCVSTLFCQTPGERLKELGIDLPEVSKPVANFVKWRKSDNLLILAGHGSPVKGKLGEDLSIEQGYEAARQSGILILATLNEACGGDLSRIKQFLKVRGVVNCTPDFTDQPKVMNGFSDLMVEVFGEKGKHARAAMGVVALPFNNAIEIEVIVELEN